MGCTLKPSTDPAVDFEGPQGEPFVVTITPEGTSSVRQTAAAYNSVTKGGVSADFVLAAGLQLLVVTYAAVKLGERGALSEVCTDGTPQRLRGIRSTNDPIRQYFIKGV